MHSTPISGPADPDAAVSAPPPANPLASLHPDCPDWQRLGPTPADAAVRAMAFAVEQDAADREQAWSKGFTRRRLFGAGAGLGVAALASQLVTTRVSYGATTSGTMIVVFLRGGMDGLSVLVPGADPYLAKARPGINVPASRLIPLNRGFGLHPSLAALKPLIAAGRVAAVPAIATPDLSRSHFQAQECLERGGSATGAQTGWLDRVLLQSGAGTTFRGVSAGDRVPRSLAGASQPLGLSDPKGLDLWVDDAMADRTRAALSKLYTGLNNPIAGVTLRALAASEYTGALAKAEPTPAQRGYPAGDIGTDMATLASLIRRGAGLRVGTVDIGGWDMHTDLGTVDQGDMKTMLTGVGAAIAAFYRDIGTRAGQVTMVVMSEFGRRVAQNNNAGTDHGHGGVALVIGGGVRGGVWGRWNSLAPANLDQGDVPGLNDYRNVLGEVVMRRLGLTSTQMAAVFPGWRVTRLGVMG